MGGGGLRASPTPSAVNLIPNFLPAQGHFVEIKCHVHAGGIESQLGSHFLDAPFPVLERNFARFPAEASASKAVYVESIILPDVLADNVGTT